MPWHLRWRRVREIKLRFVIEELQGRVPVTVLQVGDPPSLSWCSRQVVLPPRHLSSQAYGRTEKHYYLSVFSTDLLDSPRGSNNCPEDSSVHLATKRPSQLLCLCVFSLRLRKHRLVQSLDSRFKAGELLHGV